MNTIVLIILLIACALVLEICIEHVYMRTEKYKASLCGAAAFYHVPENIGICNVGSGPGLYGISYEACWKRGFNFSTAPQNYRYAFRLLRHFQDKIDRKAIIVIIMCPLSFGENKDYTRRGYSDKFYGILPPSEIDGYSVMRAIWLRHPLLKRAVGKLVRSRKTKAASATDELGIITAWKEEFDLHDLFDVEQAENHTEAFLEKIQILEEGIAYCYGQNWRPVFVIPPIPEGTRRYIGTEFLQKFVFDNLDVVRNHYKDVPLLDYYSDIRFAQDAFQGDVFLNENGRQRFSTILFDDLMRIFEGGNST